MGIDGMKLAVKRLAERMKKDKRLEIGVYALLLLAGAALYFSASNTLKQHQQTQPVQDQAEQYAATEGEAEVERRLEEILGCIRGAGDVKVMITYDTGKQLIPAMSVDTQSSVSETTGSDAVVVSQNRTESSQPAMAGGSDTVILAEKQPEVRGVIVIAEGAADVAVRMKLQSAVQTVLGVKAECIEVFEMKAMREEENG